MSRDDDYLHFYNDDDEPDRPHCCPRHPDTDLEWEPQWQEWQCPEPDCDYTWTYGEAIP